MSAIISVFEKICIENKCVFNKIFCIKVPKYRKISQITTIIKIADIA